MPATTPYTACGAILARIESSPSLVELLVGGAYHNERPPTDQPREPYLVASEVASRPERNTGPGYASREWMQISLFGSSLETLAAIESALDALLCPLGSPSLALADGYLEGIFLGSTSDGPGEVPQSSAATATTSASSVRLYQRILEVHALMVRNPIPTPNPI